MSTHDDPSTVAKPEGLTHMEYVTPVTKTTKRGLVLIPQPSDDPQDPLNWPMRKKCTNLGIVTAASFAGAGVCVINAAGLFDQAAVYHVSAVEMTYGISAGVAGLAIGPFIWSPMSRKFGKSALIFWTCVLTMATSIWGATCTHESDYISFVVSRIFGGIFGSGSTTVGAGLIIDILFLHQRGKTFTLYSVMLLVGTVAIPTFSGFIVTFTSWTIQFWYHVGLEGAIALLAFLFLEETGFSRPGGPVYPTPPRGWLQNRFATFCYPSKVLPKHSLKQILAFGGSQFIIMIAPVSLICGAYLFVMFGWAVAVNNLLGIFLQTPVVAGGYGFTPLQNSYFLFTSWLAVAAAQIYGYLITDRLSRSTSAQGGLILQPVGLGVFGAGLRYHYSPVVLALGSFLISFSAIVAVPVIDTYVVECFTSRAVEANGCMNLFRLVFGIAIVFFIDPWIAAVGINWVFGMAAIFSVLIYVLIVLLMLKGHAIRSATLGHMAADEEGTRVTQVESNQPKV